MNRLGYLIKSGITGIFSHGLMSFATVTIIMACLIIMGSFGLLVVNINDMLAGLEDENEVVAFVDDVLTLEEAQALQPLVEAVPNVAGVEFITNEEAMEDFQEDYDPELFDILDASAFRHRYVIHLTRWKRPTLDRYGKRNQLLFLLYPPIERTGGTSQWNQSEICALH